MSKLKVILSMFVLAGLLCCQKKETVTTQPEEIQVNITVPAEGQVYKTTDTVFVRAQISYTSQMHGYILRVRNAQTDSLLFDTEGHTHSDRITVEEQWPVNGNTGNMRVELIAIADHNNNEKLVKVGISSQP